MKFLGDVPIGQATIQHLWSLGHDATGIQQVLHPKAADTEIVNVASNEDRIIICFDLDFPAILAQRRTTTPSIILFRTRKRNASDVNRRLDEALAKFRPELEQGAIVIIEDNRIRVRKLPILPK